MWCVADLGEDSLAHGVGWGTATVCISWWRCRPGMLGLISWLCHRHVFGLSLSVSKCASCVIDGFHGHLVVWDDGHWAPPVMLTGMKEAPRLGSWTRLLAVIITGWTKLINGMVIGCYHTCDDAALLLSVIPVSFTPAWNVKAETFSLMLFEASLEKTAWVCFTHSLVSDGF